MVINIICIFPIAFFEIQLLFENFRLILFIKSLLKNSISVTNGRIIFYFMLSLIDPLEFLKVFTNIINIIFVITKFFLIKNFFIKMLLFS